MSHVPHELADEFPELKEKIHALKLSDRHFARLFEDYHHLNREIHRVEASSINISDESFEEMKKSRLKLKDELFQLLSAA